MIVYGAKKNFNISAKVAIESERVNEWMKAKILFAVYLGQQNLLSLCVWLCMGVWVCVCFMILFVYARRKHTYI